MEGILVKKRGKNLQICSHSLVVSQSVVNVDCTVLILTYCENLFSISLAHKTNENSLMIIALHKFVMGK